MAGEIATTDTIVQVNVTESVVALTVVSNPVAVTVSDVGIQGPTGLTGATGATGATGSSGVIGVTAPITNSGTSTSAQLGLDQTALSITPSQVAGTAVITTDSRLSDTRTPTDASVTDAKIATTLSPSKITGTAAVLGSANAFTVGGHTITNAVASIIPLQINGAASQSANLFEVRNSTPAIIARITSSGGVFLDALGASTVNAGNAFVVGSAYGGVRYNNAMVSIPALSQIGTIIRASASQTPDLFQFQSSTSTILGGHNALAQIYSGSTAPLYKAQGGATTATLGDGTTATITTTSAHGFAVGDLVVVAGITPAGYNGTFSITAVGTTTISYLNATTGAQTVAGTVSVPPQASITPRSVGTVGLVVRAAGTQIANLQEWQDSTGTSITRITTTGSISTNSITVSGSSSFNFQTNFQNAAVTPLIAKNLGGVADVFQIQNGSAVVIAGNNVVGQTFTGSTTTINSGVGGATTAASGDGLFATLTMTTATNLAVGDRIVVAGVTPTGYNTTGALVTGVNNAGPFTVSYLNGTTGAQTVAGTVSTPAQASVTARSAGTVGQIIRGAASQSSDLQQWQTSGATVLAKIIAGGNMFATDFRTTNTYGLLGEANSGGRLFMTRGTTAVTNPGTNAATLYFRDGTTAGTLKLVVRAGTAGAETTILDNIPQT